MIRKYEVVSKYDNLILDVLNYHIDNPKAVIEISHGMAEHKERYIPFMEYFNSKSYACVIHDHRGHGKSVKDKDDLGYFNDAKADAIVEDLSLVIEDTKKRYPDKKIILLGHSMGSMVVRKYIKKKDDNIDALIVCGSPSFNPLSKLALILIKIMEIFKGERYRSSLIQNLAFGSYTKGIDGTLDERWISYNEDNVKSYHENELDGFTFTLNGFKNLFTLMQDIYHKEGWNVSNKDLPILFIAGEDDPVIISKEKYQDAQNYLKNLGYRDVENYLYPMMRHEILNENDNEIIFTDILAWMSKKGI